MNYDTPAESRRWHKLAAPKPSADAGITLVEVAIGAALIGLIATAAIIALILLNKNAVSTRIMTNAREIVQRNIEAAVGTPFTSTNIPPILALTTIPGGVVWDDDGGGDNKETIYSSRDGTGPTLKGTLMRTVVAEFNSADADIRRVKFHLDYILFDRSMSYEMTAIRAMDE